MPDTRYKELPDFFQDNIRTLVAQNNADLFLGSKLAQTPQGHYVVQQSNGTWVRFGSGAPGAGAARRALIANWGGNATPHCLTNKGISDFMGGDYVPGVCGFMPVPTSQSPCIEFKGQKFINSWNPDSIALPDAQAAADPALQDILWKTLRVWRENLCGRPDMLSLQHMLERAEGDAEEELEWRYFMSFLAKPYQQIGVNMQVNTWLLGHINGLGRGTLTSLQLPLLFGREYVVELNAGDIEERKWNDDLAGALWVIINELNVDHTNHSKWNTFIKTYSTEPVLKLVKRRDGPFDAINFANWIFTSNNEQPRCLDAKDRRNALIQCFTHEGEAEIRRAKDLALEVAKWIEGTQKTDPALVQRYAGALAHFLASHPVDDNLLDYAPDTMLKRDVTEATAHDLPGLYWLQNDDDYDRDMIHPAIYYADKYNRYNRTQIDARKMGGIMANLARRGLVKRHKKYDTKAAYWEVPSSLFPKARDVDEETKHSADEKVVSLAMMLPAPRRR